MNVSRVAFGPSGAICQVVTWSGYRSIAVLDSGLSLIELNPVIVHERGAVAVDAVAG
jgi:hypothetical protein